MPSINLNDYCRINYTLSQNVSKQTSTVTFTGVDFKVHGGKEGTAYVWHASRDYCLKVGSDIIFSWSYKTKSISYTADGAWHSVSGVTAVSRTYTHSSGKSKTISLDCFFSIDSWSTDASFGSESGVVSLTLPAIASTSSISVAAGTLGTSVTVKLTKAASGLLDTVKATCGDKSATIDTKSSKSSFSWTPPLSWSTESSNHTYAAITFTTTTYSGDTKIGSASTSAIRFTIPKSTISSTATSVNVGSSYTVSLDRPIPATANPNITNTVTVGYTSTAGVAISKTLMTKSTNSSVAWVPDITYVSNITNAKSFAATITCVSYNGTANLGSSTKTVTVNIPQIIGTEDLAPNLDTSTAVAITDLNGYLNTYSKFISGLSRINVDTSGTIANRNATIKSVTCTYNNTTKYTVSSTFTAAGSGSQAITVTVTDSRGFSTTKEFAVTVAGYSPPNVQIVQNQRCDINGVAIKTGDYALLTFTGQVTKLEKASGGFNSVYYSVKVVNTKTDSVVVDRQITSLNDIYTLTNHHYTIADASAPFDKSTAYSVTITVNDSITSYTSPSSILDPAKALIDFHKASNSIGLGTFADATTQDTLDIDLDILARQKAEFDNDIFYKDELLSTTSEVLNSAATAASGIASAAISANNAAMFKLCITESATSISSKTYSLSQYGLDKYWMVLIIFSQGQSAVIPTSGGRAEILHILNHSNSSYMHIAGRNVSISGNTLTIGSCDRKATNSSTAQTSNDTYILPRSIYGFLPKS